MAYAGPIPVRGTVLVVDDSLAMQRYLRLLLELDGYRVETADSGHEALLKLARGCTPQAMLLDVQMPGMDGLETLRRLQQYRPRPKVIMCSGADDPTYIREAIALGAYAYLAKPIRPLYLSAALVRCLNEGPEKDLQHLGAQLFVMPSPGSP